MQTLSAIHRLALTYLVTDELGEAERFAAADDGRSGDAAADLIGLLAKIYRSTGRIEKAKKAEAAVSRAHAQDSPSR